MKFRKITNKEIHQSAVNLALRIPLAHRFYGVPRGGVPAALALSSRILGSFLVERPEDCDIIVDDIIESGITRQRYAKYNKPFVALFTKEISSSSLYGISLDPKEWVVFPWEGDVEHSAEDIPRRLLQFIGEDPNRGGLKETPARFLNAWKEWTDGYGKDPSEILKVFEDGAKDYDEFVIVKDIPVYSQCEHHLAMIFGTVAIGYIPDKHIIGLSKFSRLVNIFAKRLQVQERLTVQIAQAIQDNLKPKAVGVVLKCRHMCMESRGICTPGTITITSAMLGLLRDEPETRSEFLRLIGNE